jgi:hypothetical protein
MERTEAKRYLERFIKSPSEETLHDFVIHCSYCIYEGCVNPNFPASAPCPNQCDKLSQERFSVFKAFLCSTSDYMKAWRKHPAELVLHLIQFNSYVESTY